MNSTASQEFCQPSAQCVFHCTSVCIRLWILVSSIVYVPLVVFVEKVSRRRRSQRQCQLDGQWPMLKMAIRVPFRFLTGCCNRQNWWTQEFGVAGWTAVGIRSPISDAIASILVRRSSIREANIVCNRIMPTYRHCYFLVTPFKPFFFPFNTLLPSHLSYSFFFYYMPRHLILSVIKLHPYIAQLRACFILIVIFLHFALLQSAKTKMEKWQGMWMNECEKYK